MTGPAGGRHLGEEELSDLLDGRAGPGEEAHVEACPSCRARLDAWRAAVGRLGVIGLVEPARVDRREEAVAAALRFSDEVRSARRRRAGLGAGLAAAAVVVVGVGIGLGVGLGHGSPSHPSAAKAPPAAPDHRAGASAGSPSAVQGSGSSTAGGAVAQPLLDFGSVNGPGPLVAAVNRSLAVAAYGTASGQAGQPSTAVPPAASNPDATALTPAPEGDCQAPGRLFPAGSKPSVLLRGVMVYRSVPAQVVAYQVGSTRLAVVMADNGCTVLADVTL